jgi:flagellar hook-associated protein 3 FlgL
MRLLGSATMLGNVFRQDYVRQNQAALATAQQELATQRHSDVSLVLSGQVGRNIRWHSELATVTDAMQANDLHHTRADVTQSSLKESTALASDFLKNLISSRSTENGQALLRNQAKNALSQLQANINANVGGVFVFGGQNQSKAPLLPFSGSSGETLFQNQFQAEFGMASTNSAVQSLTPDQVQNFINGGFSSLFDRSSWESRFSNATGKNVLAFTGTADSIDILANANEQPVRDLYASMVAASEITAGNLNDAAFDRLVDVVSEKVSSAVQGLTDMQARVGLNQNALQDATSQLKNRKIWLNEAILKSESVDTYESATRINGLTTQLEASYSVISRISRISLLNYL